VGGFTWALGSLVIRCAGAVAGLVAVVTWWRGCIAVWLVLLTWPLPPSNHPASSRSQWWGGCYLVVLVVVVVVQCRPSLLISRKLRKYNELVNKDKKQMEKTLT
jgi:hypothetical protein